MAKRNVVDVERRPTFAPTVQERCEMEECLVGLIGSAREQGDNAELRALENIRDYIKSERLHYIYQEAAEAQAAYFKRVRALEKALSFRLGREVELDSEDLGEMTVEALVAKFARRKR